MKIYKIAKLIDKDPSEQAETFLSCMYCKRWAVDRNNQQTWKKDTELDLDEKANMEKALHEMKHDRLNSKTGISHGICPICEPFLKEVGGWPNTNEELNYIIEKSLAQIQ